MKRPLLSLLSFHALAGMASAVTFNLAGDWLADEQGVQGIPNGSLIMLVASTEDDQFSEPSASGYVDPASDDVILGTFRASDAGGALNKGSYTASVHANFNDAENGLARFDAGDPLLIRWFPTLTEADLEKRPSGAIPYGEFRTNQVLPGSTTAWYTPTSNASTINLSISAARVGNRYNPQGAISIDQLMAQRFIAEAVLETAQAHLSISTLANGALSLTWPLLEGAQPVGQLQKSADLLHWENVPVKVDYTQNGVATAVTQPEGTAMFYRVSTVTE